MLRTISPITYTFQASDHGIHIFWITFNTTGSQTLTATDGGGLSGTATTNIIAKPTSSGEHFGYPGGASGLSSLVGNGHTSVAAGWERGWR
jgi:hypothetical protein